MPAATRVTRRLAAFALTMLATTAVAAWFAMPASAAIVSTTTSLSLSPTSASLNQPVTMTATVTAAVGTVAPTGSVNFTSVATDGTTTIGTADLVASGVGSPTSTATFTISSLPAGNYQVTASYSGAFLTFSQSTSTAKQLSVAGVTIHNTTTSLTADHTVITAGDTVTLTAHVAETDGPAIPTGTVTFETSQGGVNTLLGQADVDANGNATLSVGGWQAGSYTILGEYTGDQLDHASSAQLNLTVNSGAPAAVDTNTTVALDPSTVQTGGTVTITAHILQSRTGAIPPAGDHVNFYATAADSSQQVSLGQADVVWNANGSAPADGTATISVSGWQVGNYTIEADFTGDIFDNASFGRAALGVSLLAPTTLTYTGDASVLAGSPATISFLLADNSGVPIGNEPVTVTIDGQTQTLTTDASGTVSFVVTKPVGTYPVTASFGGDSLFLASNGSGSLEVDKVPTITAYTGDTQTGVGKIATLSATLTDENNNPLSGKLVTLSFGSVSCQSTTNINGVASCTVTVVDAPGSYTVTASFAGDGTYLSSSGPGTINVIGQGSTVIVDNTTGSFLQGSSVTLSGRLTANNAPLPNKPVTLSFGTASCNTTTDANGNASCSVTVPGPTGPTTTKASFAGDASFKPSTDTKPALVYANAPGGGSFVVGDKTATGSVYFWGAQWWKANALTFGNTQGGDPSAFKGWASSPATPQCGVNWSAAPGDSSKPPVGPLPAYMAVIVTDRNHKTGAVISGDTISIVIVKTNAGYANNPGHPGTGTVVATICTGGTDQQGSSPSTVDCSAKGAKCESLLANPSVPSGSTVSRGQTLSILYTDDQAIVGTPSAVLSNGQSLPVSVSATPLVKTPVYVDNNGGSKATKVQSLLSFTIPATLASGSYTILVTVVDADGDTDQWSWSVTVA